MSPLRDTAKMWRRRRVLGRPWFRDAVYNGSRGLFSHRVHPTVSRLLGKELLKCLGSPWHRPLLSECHGPIPVHLDKSLVRWMNRHLASPLHSSFTGKPASNPLCLTSKITSNPSFFFLYHRHLIQAPMPLQFHPVHPSPPIHFSQGSR